MRTGPLGQSAYPPRSPQANLPPRQRAGSEDDAIIGAHTEVHALEHAAPQDVAGVGPHAELVVEPDSPSANAGEPGEQEEEKEPEGAAPDPGLNLDFLRWLNPADKTRALCGILRLGEPVADPGMGQEDSPQNRAASDPAERAEQSAASSLEISAHHQEGNVRLSRVFAAPGRPDPREEIRAPLLALAGAGRASSLSDLAEPPLVPQQELRSGGSALYWFWSAALLGNGVTQLVKSVSQFEPWCYAGTIVAGAIEAITVCQKRRRNNAEQRDLEARLLEMDSAVQRHTHARTRDERSAADAQALLESGAISHRLRHERRSEAPSQTMLVRDTPLQGGAVAAKTVTWVGKLWDCVSTAVPSTISAAIGIAAGLLHALQGSQERERAESAKQALQTFSRNTVAPSATAQHDPKTVLLALDHGLRPRPAHEVLPRRFEDLLAGLPVHDLDAVGRLAKEVHATLVQNLSDATKACNDQYWVATIRAAYGLASASLSGALTIFSFEERKDATDHTALGLSALTSIWLLYTALRLHKADRARKTAVNPTAKEEERKQIRLWAHAPLNDLETCMRTVTLRERFFTSALLLRYLAAPKRLNKRAPQTLAADAEEAKRKAAKRVLALLGFDGREIGALETIARRHTSHQFIAAVERIYAHSVGKGALERKISPGVSRRDVHV